MDTPSTEDFEAYTRVCNWLNYSAHTFALADGDYAIVGSSEGVYVETKHGAEPLTEELAVKLNMNVAPRK